MSSPKISRRPDLEDGNFEETATLLPEKKKKQRDTWDETVSCLFLFLGWITCSAGTVTFQKILVTSDFPYASALNFMQTFGCVFTIGMIYVLSPESFTSFNRMCQMRKIDVLSYFLPISVCYTLWLVLHTEAYEYCSVAFVQILKCAFFPFVYISTVLTGSEQWSARNLSLVVATCLSASISAFGALESSAIGVIITLGFIFANIARQTLMFKVIKGDLKFDALTVFVIGIFFMFVALYDFFLVDQGACAITIDADTYDIAGCDGVATGYPKNCSSKFSGLHAKLFVCFWSQHLFDQNDGFPPGGGVYVCDRNEGCSAVCP